MYINMKFYHMQHHRYRYAVVIFSCVFFMNYCFFKDQFNATKNVDRMTFPFGVDLNPRNLQCNYASEMSITSEPTNGT